MTIKDKVQAARADLEGKGLKELYAWAEAQGLGNRSAFPRFKTALKELGICDWTATKASNDQARIERLTASVTHELTLFVDAKARCGRFGITNATGNPIWYGRFFDDDRSFSYGDFTEQSACECAAARKAVWFANQVRNVACQPGKTLRLTLKVDAQWLCTLSGKAAVLAEDARHFNLELVMEWVSGVSNPADRLTVGSGYQRWSDNDLTALADVIDIEQPAPAVEQEVV